MVLPSNSESAMKPPLANDGWVQKSIRVANPLTWTRRIGAACDTAQNSALVQPNFGLVTLMVRFDNDRQKFTSAVQKVPEALVEYVDGSVDDDVVRGEAEARHGGIVADLKVEGVGTGSICAGLEQQRIALSSELVGHLLVCHRVDRRLDLALRHAGIEDVDARAEVGLAGRR